MDISLHYGYYFERLFLQSPDLEQEIRLEDRNHLAAALEECTSIDLGVLFQRYFKLSHGVIQSSIKGIPSTMTKIYNLLDKWIDKEANGATYGRVNSILDEAKLIGIKQLWWIKYTDTLEQDLFEEHRSMISDKVVCLSDCSVTENEWDNFMTELSKNLKLKWSENNSRLDFFNRWLEIRGYEGALDELRDALKKNRLRRFVHKLIDHAQDKQSEMGKCFIDYMEDQYDDELSKLADEVKEDVYRALRPDDPPTEEDEAFDAIVIDGNRGFHRFYKALHSHNKCDIAKVFGNNCNGISNIKEPNQPYFTKFSAYQDMSETLEIKRFLRLYGPKGSGKSVCSYIFAQTFIQENPLSVVWFVDCKDNNSVSQSMKSFNKELCDAGISSLDGSGSNVIKQLVDNLRCHELPVLLVFDNVKKFHRQCKELCRELKTYGKSIILEISVEKESLTAHNFPAQRVSGFLPEESLQFLNPSKNQTDAAVEIAIKCNHLPSRLALVKAYCEDEENQTEPLYVEYLQLMETDGGRDIIQQWEKEIGLNRVSENVLIHDNNILETQGIPQEGIKNYINQQIEVGKNEVKEEIETQMKSDKNELETEIKSFEAQTLTITNKLKKDNETLKLNIENQQVELTKMKEKCQQSSLENKQLMDRINELMEKNHNLEEECKSKDSKYTELQNKYFEVEAERDCLRRQVYEMTVGRSSESSAALSGVSLAVATSEQPSTTSRSNVEQSLLKLVFLAIEKHESAQLYHSKILRYVLELGVSSFDVIDKMHGEPSFKLMRGLSEWKAREGSKATPQRLADMLGKNGLRDVQEEVVKIMSGETAEDLKLCSDDEDVLG